MLAGIGAAFGEMGIGNKDQISAVDSFQKHLVQGAIGKGQRLAKDAAGGEGFQQGAAAVIVDADDFGFAGKQDANFSHDVAAIEQFPRLQMAGVGTKTMQNLVNFFWGYVFKQRAVG